jgi:ribosomal RNA-processing protein 17
MLRTTAALNGSENGVDGTESADEWSGISDAEPAPVDHEAEYIDEDKYTTVTVEAMDVSREGLFKAEQAKDSENPQQEEEGGAEAEPESLSEKKKRKWTQAKPKDSADKPKRKKKRNFRYESKVDRKTARSKQKAKSSKQARERRSG